MKIASRKSDDNFYLHEPYFANKPHTKDHYQKVDLSVWLI